MCTTFDAVAHLHSGHVARFGNVGILINKGTDHLKYLSQLSLQQRGSSAFQECAATLRKLISKALSADMQRVKK
jgi:hypothetical protein